MNLAFGIQHPYLIGHEQLTSCVLIVDIAGAAAPTGNPSRPCVNGLLAQRFGDIFVCAGFIAAQIEQRITVAGHVFPTVLEQLFELCHVLDHDVDRNFTAAAGGQDTLKVLRQRNVRELIHQDSYRNRKPAPILVICRIVQLLKCLPV